MALAREDLDFALSTENEVLRSVHLFRDVGI
jgi:hypothetical protein